MSKGHHVIKGVTALEFVRQRHNIPGPYYGDFGRVRRQQYFLAQAFRQVASVGIITKLHALGDAIKRNIIVDPSLNILDLAKQMQNLSAENISGKTIPTTPETIDGNDVLAVNPKQVKSFVEKAINGSSRPNKRLKRHTKQPGDEVHLLASKQRLQLIGTSARLAACADAPRDGAGSLSSRIGPVRALISRMTSMALRPAARLPSGGDLAALFDVLRSQAFTRAVDDARLAPRDGYGIAR